LIIKGLTLSSAAAIRGPLGREVGKYLYPWIKCFW